MGFMDDIQKESKQYGGGGSDKFFKFDRAGVYQIRILVKPKVIATHFFGKGNPSHVCVGIDDGCKYHGGENDNKASIKLATYVIDRANEATKIQMAELPLSISYAINDLQEDSDFAFSEFPMPYDVKVKYDPDNADPKAKYRLQPSIKQAPITEEEQKALDEAMKFETPEQFVEKKKQKEKEKSGNATAPSGGVEYPKEDINPDDIPF
jgi:hypothetical protein